MQSILLTKQNFFFIGIAGNGMSAIAQYLSGIGKNVSGSDREFSDSNNDIKLKLEKENIVCYKQDCSGLNKDIDIVVVSTAIEKTVPEYAKSIELGLKIIHRADLLQAIATSKKSVAIAGTSGKSTTVAMLYHIMNYNGLQPSLIAGAGLSGLEKLGKLGNCVVNKGEWLLFEADESDGSLTKYFPEIGVLLNIDKDHKDLKELDEIFTRFVTNVKELLVVNHANKRSARYTQTLENDICLNDGFYATDFIQNGFEISFKLKNIDFKIPIPGYHNLENALAAISVANYIGVSIEKCSEALQNFEGIYRRLQKIGDKNGIIVIDDYAHNPAKVASAIKACQNMSKNLIAWFQPHGFAPTKFLKNDFVEEISKVLRQDDEIWMSEIFYAGGTVNRDISANDLITEISAKGKKAFFCEKRNDFVNLIKNKLKPDTIILLMGARDITLQRFANYVFSEI